MRNNIYIYPIATSLILCVLYILFIDYISVPWVDEAGTVDTSINVLTKHKWYSTVWPYSYNLLHAFLYIGWLSIWGISRLAICSMDVFIMFIASILLIRILIKRLHIVNTLLLVAFVFLFLGSYHMFLIATGARIDPLALLFAILLADSIYQEKQYVKLFIYSFLLFASATYPLPVFGVYMLIEIIVKKNERLENIKKLFLIIAGPCVALGLICVFYYYHNFIYNYIGTFLFFSSSGYKGNILQTLLNNYLYNPEALLLVFVSAFLLLLRKPKEKQLYYYLCIIISIPLILTLFGHYVFCYSWMIFVPISALLTYLLKDTRTSNSIAILCFAVVLSIVSISVKVSKYQTIRKDVISYNNYFSNKTSDSFVFVNTYHAYYSVYCRNDIYCINVGLNIEDHGTPIIEDGLIKVPIIVKDEMSFLHKEIIRETPCYTIPSQGYFIIDNVELKCISDLEELYNVKLTKEKEFYLSTVFKYVPSQE